MSGLVLQHTGTDISETPTIPSISIEDVKTVLPPFIRQITEAGFSGKMVLITKPYSNTLQKPVISAPSTTTISTLTHSSFCYYLYQYTSYNVACQQMLKKKI